MRKKILALFCALALCLTLPGPASAAGSVYFTALNDNLLELSSASMPTWSRGVLYVPASVFDGSNSAGVSFGINFSYNRKMGTASLYTTQKFLTFDLNNGTSYNYLTGEELSGRAILRGGRPYLPVAQVCSFFGLSYSVISIDEGYVVRVKSSDVILSDSDFVDAASNLISRRLRDYNQANQSSPTPGVLPPTSGGDSNTTAPADTPIQEEPENTDTPLIYLGFRCDDTEGLSQVLDALEAQNKVGIFFFPADGLDRSDDLLYRILGSGHSIGILAEGDTAAETSRLLEAGSDSLERSCYTRTTLALVPKGQMETLRAAGWVCWDETVSAVPSTGISSNSYASSVIRRVGTQVSSAYVTLDAGAQSARVLPTLLQRLETKSYTVSVPLETRL